MRRQSIAGASTKLRNAVDALFQAQRVFRVEMQVKTTRQLQTAFPGASAEDVAAVASRGRSAASAIQESVNLQPGCASLNTRIMLPATDGELDQLEELAKAARMLQQAFAEAELLIKSQGEVINDIAVHVSSAARSQAQAQQGLLRAHEAHHRGLRQRLQCCVVGILILIIAVVVFFALRH